MGVGLCIGHCACAEEVCVVNFCECTDVPCTLYLTIERNSSQPAERLCEWADYLESTGTLELLWSEADSRYEGCYEIPAGNDACVATSGASPSYTFTKLSTVRSVKLILACYDPPGPDPPGLRWSVEFFSDTACTTQLGVTQLITDAGALAIDSCDPFYKASSSSQLSFRGDFSTFECVSPVDYDFEITE